MSPIFDLHLYRARNPSEVAWGSYDLIALVQVSVDFVALSSGLDGNLGAPREVVLAEMARVAAAMAPHRPSDEHVHVVTHVLDHLLRHGEPSPYFSVEYADPDTSWQTVVQPVRVLYEALAADGQTLHVNVDNTAVALLLIATNRSLEDEHEAVIAVLQAQEDESIPEWELLAQWEGLPMATIYWTIPRQDLAEMRFDRVLVQMYANP